MSERETTTTTTFFGSLQRSCWRHQATNDCSTAVAVAKTMAAAAAAASFAQTGNSAAAAPLLLALSRSARREQNKTKQRWEEASAANWRLSHLVQKVCVLKGASRLSYATFTTTTNTSVSCNDDYNDGHCWRKLVLLHPPGKLAIEQLPSSLGRAHS